MFIFLIHKFYTMKIIVTFVLTLCAFTFTIAQTGQYDVRLVQQHPFQCGDGVIYFDIEIKSSNPGTAFRVSEQNYRFDYDSLILANPRIDQELGLSGMINDGIGVSAYDTHTLEGTLGPTISYNVELLSGVGYPIFNLWLPIGRIAFDVVDGTNCANLVWRTHTDFPITFIGEVSNGILLEASEGNYSNYSGCLPAICVSCPLSLGLSYVIPDNIYSADVSITSDGTIPGGGNVDYKAGNVILLDSGFSVEPQADFSAVIDDCN